MVSENKIPLAAANQFIPGTPCEMTVRRWAARGLRGVKLETYPTRPGGRLYTDLDMIRRFLAQRPTNVVGRPRNP